MWQFFLPSEIVLTLYGKEGKKLQVNNYHERMNMPGFFNWRLYFGDADHTGHVLVGTWFS